MKIGIFGGAFDPVHKEHVNICVWAKRQFDLDKVIVIPSGVSPHKSSDGLTADAHHGLEMAKIAFSAHEGVTVSDYEIKKPGPSYTYLTLRHFRQLYPNDKLFFIMGGDSFAGFLSWKKPGAILSECSLIVCGREGFDLSDAAQEVEERFGKRALFCSYRGKKVSSTAIKVFLEFGVDVSEYLDEGVLRYIKRHNLYSNYRFYIDRLKRMLSEKRYVHTIFTVIKALELARRVGCDLKKTFIAAALHDCTKKLSDEKLRELGFVLAVDVPEAAAHSVSGSFIARTIFKVKDRDILNSIRYHTTGRPGMSLLEKVIYVADCIEETRNYEGVEELRKAVEEDFEKGFLMCMELTMNQLMEDDCKRPVSDLTFKAFEYYKELERKA
jgi:nicotinate-nucleotide adenylyltransferase